MIESLDYLETEPFPQQRWSDIKQMNFKDKLW